MTILFFLLVGALVPTVTQRWVFAMQDSIVDNPDISGGRGIPAYCFWSLRRGDVLNMNAPFSLLLLTISYGWKLCQLNDKSQFAAKKWLRCFPQWVLERIAIWVLERYPRRSLRRFFAFYIFALIYVPFIAIFEFLESFLATLWLLTLGLIWGTMQIFVPRLAVGQGVNTQESFWGFGQILPLLLLLQPLVAIIELLNGKFFAFQQLLQMLRNLQSQKTVGSKTILPAATPRVAMT